MHGRVAFLASCLITSCGFVIEPDEYRGVSDGPAVDGGSADGAPSEDGGRLDDLVDHDQPDSAAPCTDQIRWIHDPVVLEGTGVGLIGTTRGTLLVARSADSQTTNFSADAPLVVLNQGQLGNGRLHWLEVALNIDPRSSGTEQAELQTGFSCTLEVQLRFLPELTQTSTWIAPLHSEVRIDGPLHLSGDQPVTIRSLGPARITAAGAIHVDADGPTPGPGGFSGGAIGERGAGGGGGSSSNNSPQGGRNVGAPHIWPLTGSGGGGGGGGSSAVGGGGGGVLRLIASEAEVNGTLTARGGDGESDGNSSCIMSGAGGSGGSIWIQAPTVNLASGSTIDTSGGRSGGVGCNGGDGAMGKLRIDGFDGPTLSATHRGPNWSSTLPSVLNPSSPNVAFMSGAGTVFVAVKGGRQKQLSVEMDGNQQTSLQLPNASLVTRICIGRTPDEGEQHCLAVLLAP